MTDPPNNLVSKLDLEQAIAGVNERFATLTLDMQAHFADVRAGDRQRAPTHRLDRHISLHRHRRNSRLAD